MKHPYIIAEIGSNCFKTDSEDRNLDYAIKQIRKAKTAGADAVKFQYFSSRELWGAKCKEKTFAEVQDKYAMPGHWVPKLRLIAKKAGIDFLCSGFSLSGYKLLERYVKIHKIASPEIFDRDVMDFMLTETEKPKIFSLGCCDAKETEILFEKISPKDAVLQCVSEYPAKAQDYDLFTIQYFAKKYTKLKWGISDHTRDSQLAISARAAGASYFEKHVDFYPYEGKNTPDSGVSINGECFRKYVEDIRSQEPIDYDVKKRLAYRLYGRRRTRAGYFRPFPEGAPGTE